MTGQAAGIRGMWRDHLGRWLERACLLSMVLSVGCDGGKPGAGESDVAAEWAKLKPMLEAPATPVAWEKNPPSEAELMQYQRGLGVDALAVAQKLRVFQESHPDSKESFEARVHEAEILGVAVQAGQTQEVNRLVRVEDGLLGASLLSARDRLQIRLRRVQRLLAEPAGHSWISALDAMDSAVKGLRTEFPKEKEPVLLQLALIDRWIDAGEWSRAEGLLAEVPVDWVGEEIGRRRQGLQRRIQRHGTRGGSPLTLLDGSTLDVGQWKGQVVVIHFWAAASPASLRDLPRLSGLYQRLKTLGVQMVSVSVDPDRLTWENRLSAQPMSWPQAYEGPQGPWVERCGILTVPALWLVDRQGVFRSYHGTVEIAGAAAKLVAEAAP